MRRTIIRLTLAVGLTGFSAASPVLSRTLPKQSAIAFANSGGIADWVARDDATLFIMDRGGRWYRASFSGPCWQLSHSSTIAFEPDRIGRFDASGAVHTPYGLCQLNSLVRAQRPAEKGLKGIASATR